MAHCPTLEPDFARVRISFGLATDLIMRRLE
jgi:hypothetical protein